MRQQALLKILIYSLEFFVGCTALLGGILLIVAPSGERLGFSADWLMGSPFSDYLVPGFLLAALIGIGSLMVCLASVMGSRRSSVLGVLDGLTLILWIGFQILWIGYRHPLQPLYAVIGLIILQGAIVLYKGDAVRFRAASEGLGASQRSS